MCARVLKMANSAFYSQSRRVSSIGDAVVILGFDEIVQLMLATTVFKSFGPTGLGSRLDLHGLWKHSMAAAVTSKMIAEETGRTEESNLAYTAGLLHDIGKLVLANYFRDEYIPVFEKLESEGLFLHEAEMLILGFTHGDVGGWLFGKWNFPERIIDIVTSHHEDTRVKQQTDEEFLGVRLANILCNLWQIGDSGNKKTYELETKDYSLLGLNEYSIELIEQTVRESEKEIDLFLQVMA